MGAAVRATDANNDRLTYSIPASDYIEIDASSGQLRTKAELDHEATPTLNIRVTATDPGGLSATIAVTITVEDVDETPEISGPQTVDFDEGGTGTVATYTATDPDDTGIDWMLTGTDSDDFTLSGGTLSFRVAPDYEEKNSYRVTIEAHEQSGGTSVARLSVTVRVTNVDEDGMVVVPVSEPRVGQQLTPTVEDPDGGVGSIEWKWESSPNGINWPPIPGGTSRSYTPTRDDNGKELRVVAIYRDREGPGKTEIYEFSEAVVLRPYFDSDTATRSIQENTADGRNVGARFTASHPDNVNLTYSLTGGDISYFAIDPTNGQLMTSATPLDYETLAGHEAEAEITATDNNGQTAAITVAITVTNECTSAGEPPCAPGRPSTSSASDTSLRVSWSAPRTPSGTSITGYDLQYRESGIDAWTSESVTGTDRAHSIENLFKGTIYEVQVRASNDSSRYGEWSQSGTGTPGYVPPPPPPPPPPDPDPPITTTGGGGGGSSGGGSGGGGGGGGGGGFAPPAPPAPPRPVSGFQPVEELFRPLSSTGSLTRVWRFLPRSQSWLFYDPDPLLRPFNTMRTLNVAADPPNVVVIGVERSQRYRGILLYQGWNVVPVSQQPLTLGAGTQPVRQLLAPLISNRTLNRAWWLDSRTQEWKFFDPDPDLAAFNSISTLNLAANPPVVLMVNVSRGQQFRGQELFPGWNHVVMR